MPSNACSLDHRAAALVGVGERDLVAARAVQHDVLHALGQLLERPVEVEPEVLREALQHLEVELVAPVPALDRAGRERQVREGDDALRVEEADRPEAVAARARAHRVVEREQARLELGQRVVADRAGELGREEVLARRCPSRRRSRGRRHGAAPSRTTRRAAA